MKFEMIHYTVQIVRHGGGTQEVLADAAHLPIVPTKGDLVETENGGFFRVKHNIGGNRQLVLDGGRYQITGFFSKDGAGVVIRPSGRIEGVKAQPTGKLVGFDAALPAGNLVNVDGKYLMIVERIISSQGVTLVVDDLERDVLTGEPELQGVVMRYTF